MKKHLLSDLKKREPLTRISMSLPTKLLIEFDKSMLKSGYTDRSKALQTAIHTFVNDYTWNTEEKQSGAGAIIVVYDNHIYNQDEKSIQVQHEYQDVIGATTHLHLKGDNCLETIMVRGNIKKIKELTKYLSENRGIKSLKLHFMTTF
ncbi:MAG TPA: hypothetical protein VH500_04110 [Nitrososphaeraceae archaeon]